MALWDAGVIHSIAWDGWCSSLRTRILWHWLWIIVKFDRDGWSLQCCCSRVSSPTDWETNDCPREPRSRSFKGWCELWYWSLHRILWSFEMNERLTLIIYEAKVTENFRDTKRDLKVPECITVNHSAQNHISDNKATAISIYIGYMASRHPILNFFLIQCNIHNRSRDPCHQHWKPIVMFFFIYIFVAKFEVV